MSDQYDNMIAVSAAWEIDRRLIYHTQAGRLLAGLKYDQEATLKVDGYDDLPLLQPYTINIDEAISPGAPKSGTNGPTLKNTPVAETLTLVYRVAVSRKHLWFRRDPTDSTQPKGFLEWLALIRDAIESTPEATPTPDSALNIGAIKPVSFSIRETETTQLCFAAFLEVVIAVPHYCRRERSYTLPAP